jgi:serine/threonine protein phosphatase 1
VLGGQRKTIRRLAERVAGLPIALHVAGDVPFNVPHGDLLPLGSTRHDLPGVPTLSVHEACACTTSRRNMGAAVAGGFVALRFVHRPIRISDRPSDACRPYWITGTSAAGCMR